MRKSKDVFLRYPLHSKKTKESPEMSQPGHIHVAREFQKLNEEHEKYAPQRLLKEFLDWMFSEAKKKPWKKYFTCFVPSGYGHLVQLIQDHDKNFFVWYETIDTPLRGRSHNGFICEGSWTVMWLFVSWERDLPDSAPRSLERDTELHKQALGDKFVQLWLCEEDLMKFTGYTITK